MIRHPCVVEVPPSRFGFQHVAPSSLEHRGQNEEGRMIGGYGKAARSRQCEQMRFDGVRLIVEALEDRFPPRRCVVCRGDGGESCDPTAFFGYAE